MSGPNNSGKMAQEDTDELYGSPDEEDKDEEENENPTDDEENG